MNIHREDNKRYEVLGEGKYFVVLMLELYQKIGF
jgi:hypothetical protein